VNLHVDILGSGSRPLVLLHGWAFNSSIWQSLVPHLDRDYRLHLVDLPGHGRSPPPPADCALSQVAAAVAASVPPGCLWMGWSLGGLIALQVAATLPSTISALLLVATTPRFVEAPDWPHAVSPAVLAAFRQELESEPIRTLGRFIALQVHGTPDARSVARSLSKALLAGGLPSGRSLDTALTWLAETDLRPLLTRVHCPTRLILGERDTLVPATVLADIRAYCPAWDGVLMCRAGHAPFVTDPAAFARVALRETPSVGSIDHGL